MLWGTPAGGALWPLDPDGAARDRLGRPFLSALGISGSLHREAPSRDSDLHRVARGHSAHAARKIPCIHVLRFVALVLCARLFWNEAGRKLARAGKIFP